MNSWYLIYMQINIEILICIYVWGCYICLYFLFVHQEGLEVVSTLPEVIEQGLEWETSESRQPGCKVSTLTRAVLHKGKIMASFGGLE